jgi:hypothetical protein
LLTKDFEMAEMKYGGDAVKSSTRLADQVDEREVERVSIAGGRAGQRESSAPSARRKGREERAGRERWEGKGREGFQEERSNKAGQHKHREQWRERSVANRRQVPVVSMDGVTLKVYTRVCALPSRLPCVYEYFVCARVYDQ